MVAPPDRGSQLEDTGVSVAPMGPRQDSVRTRQQHASPLHSRSPATGQARRDQRIGLGSILRRSFDRAGEPLPTTNLLFLSNALLNPSRYPTLMLWMHSSQRLQVRRDSSVPPQPFARKGRRRLPYSAGEVAESLVPLRRANC